MAILADEMNSLLSVVLAILFIIQAFVPSMDLCCELEKLPSLYEHYNEHAIHDGTSAVEFLELHYGDDAETLAHHHSDDHDSKLPFHGDHKCHHASYYTNLEHHFLIKQMVFPDAINSDNYSFFIKSEFPDAPFQPPKV